jgi:hypothetical protein
MHRRITRYTVSLFTSIALLAAGSAHAATPTLESYTKGGAHHSASSPKGGKVGRLHTGRLHTGRLHTG